MQHEQLILKAAALAKAAPIQWGDFLKAFADYKEKHRDNAIQSPPETLQTNQGRAQLATTTYSMLEKAVESAEEITRKRNNGKPV